jgi:hypothetical protein
MACKSRSVSLPASDIRRCYDVRTQAHYAPPELTSLSALSVLQPQAAPASQYRCWLLMTHRSELTYHLQELTKALQEQYPEAKLSGCRTMLDELARLHFAGRSGQGRMGKWSTPPIAANVPPGG